jgi:D-inositol-3-phosphate glycosyltransferase
MVFINSVKDGKGLFKMDKKTLLVIADSPTCHTGFGVVSENILLNLPSTEWDIHVLALNYFGDHHKYQTRFKLYNPTAGNDVYGFNRLRELIVQVQPHMIFIINDPWMVNEYVLRIRKISPDVPIVAYTPVDSPGIKPEFIAALNQTQHIVSYTQFGVDELRKSGITVPISVIPHGVNPGIFNPIPHAQARRELYGGVKELEARSPYVVLYVARNQPRKRVDLFVYTMFKWLQKYPHDDVVMHYHGAPKGDLGNDIQYLVEYFGKTLGVKDFDKRLILTSKTMTAASGLPADKMRIMYSGADLYFQVCAVEGWGLPLMEAMACGVPALVPNYSALTEWPNGAVEYVKVHDTPWMNINNIDTHHKFIDVDDAVEKLEYLYQNKERRDELGKLAVKHVTQKKFMWKEIAAQFNTILHQKRGIQGEESWQQIAAKLRKA